MVEILDEKSKEPASFEQEQSQDVVASSSRRATGRTWGWGERWGNPENPLIQGDRNQFLDKTSLDRALRRSGAVGGPR